jgi:hypothetical protein
MPSTEGHNIAVTEPICEKAFEEFADLWLTQQDAANSFSTETFLLFFLFSKQKMLPGELDLTLSMLFGFYFS